VLRIQLIKVACFLHVMAHATVFSFGQKDVLQEYVEIGLASNLVVKQRTVALENALNVLKQAKYLYIPTLDFQMLYTTAQGGRQIGLPVGDMLNPVYTTLNQMMGSNAFPMIENQNINFLPKNYYDARVRLAVPIINMDIVNNKRIVDKQLAIQENEVEIYQRELVKDIKTSYYNYLSVLKGIEVKQNALDLALTGKRNNEKLVEAGKGLHAYVLRSETEVAQIESDIIALQGQLKSLKNYFNLLLNRDQNEEIVVAQDERIIPFNMINQPSVDKREEIESLNHAIDLREDIVRFNKQTLLPKLNGFADLGSQAEQMKFNDKSVYYMVGLQLNIPIFNGFKTNLKIKEAKNNVEIAQLQKEYVENQLSVSLAKSYNDAMTAKQKYEASLKQLEMAETYHRLIEKGYAAGVNTYIETVDARAQLSNAKLNVNVQYYQFLSALANLEREAATYELPNLIKENN